MNNLPHRDQRKWEEHKKEWGEDGSPGEAWYNEHTVSVATRTTIIENHKGNVAKNATERQKQRTFL